MGFFSELKEDLSQAVSELLPIEETENKTENKTENETEKNPSPVSGDSEAEETASKGSESKDLNSLEADGLNSKGLNSEDPKSEELNPEGWNSRGLNSEGLNSEGSESEDPESGWPSSEGLSSEGLNSEGLNSIDLESETPESEELQSEGWNSDSSEPEGLESRWTESGNLKYEESALDGSAAGISLEEMLEKIDTTKLSQLDEDADAWAEPETVTEENEKTEVQDTIGEEPVRSFTEESKGARGHMDSLANRELSDETAVITAGMKIHGDIESEGSMDVIGAVEGNIDILGKLNITGHINGNSKAAEVYAEGAKITGEIVSDGAVKIGDSSVIIGNIIAKSAAIAGAVKGDIDVQGPVILDSSAIVMGNIKSKSVQINNGAVIEGMCSQCYADVSPVSFFEGL